MLPCSVSVGVASGYRLSAVVTLGACDGPVVSTSNSQIGEGSELPPRVSLVLTCHRSRSPVAMPVVIWISAFAPGATPDLVRGQPDSDAHAVPVQRCSVNCALNDPPL